MDLRNFIKETLVQIAQGIDDASQALEGSTAIVNPRSVIGAHGTNDAKVYGYVAKDKNMRQAVQSINFDVAISVAKGTETKGGVGLMVGAVALGSQGKSDASNTSQSRIQFTIPMVLPTQENG
jgi:hypothetical protein